MLSLQKMHLPDRHEKTVMVQAAVKHVNRDEECPELGEMNEFRVAYKTQGNFTGCILAKVSPSGNFDQGMWMGMTKRHPRLDPRYKAIEGRSVALFRAAYAMYGEQNGGPTLFQRKKDDEKR